jgi:hypothetical protein
MHTHNTHRLLGFLSKMVFIYACLNRVCVSWEQYVLCGQPRAILHVTPGRYCALANARVGSCNIHLTSRDYLQVVAFMPVSFGFFMIACLA